MKGKIAVTPRSLSIKEQPAFDDLRNAGYEVIFPTPGRQPTLQELREFLPSCDGYLAGVEPVPGEILRQCPKLKVISRNGVGVDNIDLAAAEELGIAVEKTGAANSRGVAELAITLMLAGLRSVCWSDRGLKNGAWSRQEGIEIEGRVLGVIGCGQIGKLVVLMGLGLGMRVVAFDTYQDESFKPGFNFQFVSLKELLSSSDVITLHCPPGKKPLIDAEALAQMRDGVFIINTARAALVEDQAVLDAIESGKLRGFATDVYEHEPPELSQLLLHDRVITTPHIGGYTQESVQRATETAVKNLLKVLG